MYAERLIWCVLFALVVYVLAGAVSVIRAEEEQGHFRNRGQIHNHALGMQDGTHDYRALHCRQYAWNNRRERITCRSVDPIMTRDMEGARCITYYVPRGTFRECIIHKLSEHPIRR